MMPSLREAVGALLADPADRVLARSIFGTDDAERVAARVESFVAEALGRRIVGCPLFTQSVGAVLGLHLDDGRTIALKAHAVGDGRSRSLTGSELVAVYEAHAHLAAAGFPVPGVVCPPRPWPGGAVASIGWLPAGRGDDPHRPEVAVAMATVFAELTEACRALDPRRLPRSRLPAGALFPPAHNALFDLGAPGGEWIDAHARRAREAMDAVPEAPVATHTDVSAANVVVSSGRVAAIYDVDSVAVIDEWRCLASVAVHFTYRGDPPWSWPSLDESRAFVATYLRARGRSPNRAEAARLDAAARYAMAYTARCERSLGHEAGMAERLRAAPERVLSA